MPSRVGFLSAVVAALFWTSGANAGTIDIIFTSGCTRGNGTANCSAPDGATLTAVIELTTAPGDTQLGGGSAVSSYVANMLFNNVGGVFVASPAGSASNTPPSGWSVGPPGVPGAPLYTEIVSGNDILIQNPLPTPDNYELGTLPLLVNEPPAPGLGLLSLNNVHVVGNNGFDVTSEYTLGHGIVTAIATPPSLSGMSLVYFEEFTQEFGVPTTPEIDLLSAGSVMPYQSGNGPPPAPMINPTGGVDFSVMAVDGAEINELQGIAVVPTPIPASDDVAVRIESSGANSTKVVPYFLQQSVVMAFDDGLGAGLDVALSAGLVSYGVGGSPVAQFQLTRMDVSTGTTTGLDVVPLPPSLLASLAGGQMFQMTLRLERASDSATAHIISGADELLLSGSASVAGRNVISANGEVLVLNTISGVGSSGQDDSNAVYLSDIAIFRAPPADSVPALGSTAALFLAGLLASCGTWVALRARAAH